VDPVFRAGTDELKSHPREDVKPSETRETKKGKRTGGRKGTLTDTLGWEGLELDDHVYYWQTLKRKEGVPEAETKKSGSGGSKNGGDH